MRPTLQYVRQKFDEFNALIFDGALPPIPIKLSNARSYLGICRYKRRRKLFGKEELYDFRLFISTRLDLPEQEVEDTIIHEMIHYYIGVNGIRDTSAHGEVFRRMMNSINREHGRRITVSHKSTAAQREEAMDTRPRLHVVAVVRLKDGRMGIKVIPRNERSILAYRRALALSGKVGSMDFYLTADPYFNRFPRSAAPKVYFVGEEEVGEHLSGARRLQF